MEKKQNDQSKTTEKIWDEYDVYIYQTRTVMVAVLEKKT